jgi:hypothetical protein
MLACRSVSEAVEILERRIDRLRVAVREAVLAGERERASALRRELRQAEHEWEDALARAEESLPPPSEPPPSEPRLSVPRASEPWAAAAGNAPLLPLREQVHEALALLAVPAAPRLIAAVHEAFFATTVPGSKLTSLKRDEERSFRTAPYARPYYICAVLAADLLAPARGLLAVSTWPMERRVIGSLSPRVDFLTAAINVAAAVERLTQPVPAARRLLWRFAASIPGAAEDANRMKPRDVIHAAEAEREVHEPGDREARGAAARRAREQLDDAQQLFGVHLRTAATQPGRTQGRRA